MWRKFRSLPTWVQVVAWVVLVLVILGAAGVGEEDNDTTQEAESQAPAVTEAPTPTEPDPVVSAPPTTERATTRAPTTIAGPRTSFGNGTHRVGPDIAPGTYSAPGGTTCYWARLSGFGGSLGEIIANSIGSGAQVVTIAATDAGFESRGCGTWTQG